MFLMLSPFYMENVFFSVRLITELLTVGELHTQSFLLGLPVFPHIYKIQVVYAAVDAHWFNHRYLKTLDHIV